MRMMGSMGSWAMKVGYKVLRERREIMGKLPYAAIWKYTGVAIGAKREMGRKVVVVESIDMFTGAAAYYILARTMCDTFRTG